MHPIVIIGTGLAGYTLARELRKLDSVTPLVMITADDGGFYSKPMLSNALLRGKSPAQLISADAEKMAADINAVIKVRTRVEAIDIAAHTVTANGETIGYSRLVLAVGARPIRLPLEGDGATDVLTVNSLEDYAQFHEKLQGTKRVAVIGPGLIGCEFANDLVGAGHQVSIIGPDPHPLGRLLPGEVGNAVRTALGAIGIQWHLGTVVSRVERNGSAYRLVLADGSEVNADVVLSAIGLQADIRLAQQAGLVTNRGIVVDAQLRASAADVYALGDCAEVNGMVLPFVLPLMEQARTLAAVLAGREAAVNYPPMPVAVKTPACPVVVSPPAPGAPGEWRVQVEADGVRAEFIDGTQLRGFALAGAATAAKQALVKQLAAL